MGSPWQIPVSQKQLELVKLCSPHPGKPKYVLCSGPRFATKTVGCLHTIANHLWNVNHASFSVISPTVTAADDEGCWSELTREVLPQWIAGNFGMRWKTEPKQKGVTKKVFCEVYNKFGTTSRVQIDSLKYEKDVEARFKNKSYSGIYVSELSYYTQRKTFDILIEVLRGSRWKEEDLIFLGDTNPADEGELSWIYKLWYEFRLRDDLSEDEEVFRDKLALREFTVADNIFVSPERLKEQFARYAHSPDLMARYYWGKWVSASREGIFIDQFRPQIHTAGEEETPANKDPEILIPEENCSELITGWDIGIVNSGFTIKEKVVPNPEAKAPTSIFKVLDEVVYLGEDDLGMDDFVEECLGKILWWEAYIGKPIRWRNWSDRSAFDRKEPISRIYHHQLVYMLTNKKIELKQVERNSGSVLQRVDLTKKLLFEHRILISKSRCPNLIASLQSLKPGKGTVAVQRDSPFKHVWDAFTYAVSAECYDELLRHRRDLNIGRASSKLVTIGL